MADVVPDVASHRLPFHAAYQKAVAFEKANL